MTELNNIAGLKRIESFTRDEMGDLCMDETRSVYPHKEMFGDYCTIEEYINCPPEKVFEYLAFFQGPSYTFQETYMVVV